jgi:hypothetical protein
MDRATTQHYRSRKVSRIYLEENKGMPLELHTFQRVLQNSMQLKNVGDKENMTCWYQNTNYPRFTDLRPV